MFTKIFCQSHNDIREKISGSITIYQPNLRALTGMRTMMGWVRKSKSLSLPPVLLARPQEDSRQPLTSSRKSSFKEMPWKTQGWAVFLLLSLVTTVFQRTGAPGAGRDPRVQCVSQEELPSLLLKCVLVARSPLFARWPFPSLCGLSHLKVLLCVVPKYSSYDFCPGS